MIVKKLELYIETSTWNFLFANDAPEKREITKAFFNVVDTGAYEIYISEIVINEILRAPLGLRRNLMSVIEKYQPIQLETNSETRQLARAYIQAKVVPVRKVEDALHVAVATVEGVDAVISWNFDHLANLRKAELFNGVNLLHGYTKKIDIITPVEVSSDKS